MEKTNSILKKLNKKQQYWFINNYATSTYTEINQKTGFSPKEARIHAAQLREYGFDIDYRSRKAKTNTATFKHTKYHKPHEYLTTHPRGLLVRIIKELRAELKGYLGHKYGH